MVQLIKLFGSRKALQLLLLFLKNQNTEFLQKGIKKKAGLAKATMIKWLAYLVQQQIVLLERKGNLHIYRLNKENVFMKYLKIAVSLNELQSLTVIIDKYPGELYLYGSAARGEDDENSDVDLLMIGKGQKFEIMKEIEQLFPGKKITLQVFTPSEWSMLSKKDPAFYRRVQKDRILLRWT